MIRVSTVIPTCNRQDLLARALNSVIHQSEEPAEIIVIDDGSTDRTAGLVRDRFPCVRYVFQQRSGVSAARNRGIKLAQHEWIAFLDDDDEWHRDKLKTQSALMEEHPGFLVSHTNEIWIRNGIRLNQKKKHRKTGGYIFQNCLPLCVISPSSVMIHRVVFENVGVFNETLPACEDYDLWLRICSKYPVLYTDRELVMKYGGHDGQLSKKFPAMDRFRIRALESILRQGQLQDDDYLSAVRTLHDKIKIYHNGAVKRGNSRAGAEFNRLLTEFSGPVAPPDPG